MKRLIALCVLVLAAVSCNTSGAQFAKTAWGTSSYVKTTTTAPDGTKTEQIASGIDKRDIYALLNRAADTGQKAADIYMNGWAAGKSGLPPTPPVDPAAAGQTLRVN